MRTLGKRVRQQCLRGFESRPVRHLKINELRHIVANSVANSAQNIGSTPKFGDEAAQKYPATAFLDTLPGKGAKLII